MTAIKQVDLKTLARELLTTGKVEVFIGYQAATQPLTTAPLIIHGALGAGHAQQASNPEAERDLARQVEALIFDDRCEMNLANYLHKFKDRKVAIVVKGCDSRSMVGLLQEKQVDRKDLIIIGAPCRGVIDRRHVGSEIYAACRECPVHNPVIADYVIGAPVPQPDLPEITPEMEALRKASPDHRWERFHKEMSKCILCYACRNLCPACYCKTCFADASKPKWVGRTDDPADAMMFHLQRLMHLGGRCTGCGACVRGCPMQVDLRLYNDHLRSHVKQEYGFMAGMDEAAQPPLAMYGTDDCNEFIR
ncbi:MAG: 4Fe-4S dicluster domain-containing protein [Verrucomicrobia bacterium]|nr:4Fe-4S dicluster domain-containing protein [Verrucomicrobiota bacterium]